jgi:hypothetical protein
MAFFYIDDFAPKTGIFEQNKMLNRNRWSDCCDEASLSYISP